MSKPKCPYCKITLKKMPVRKTKCPNCERYFFVKSTPENREKRIMTETEALEAEKKWADYHEYNCILSNLSSFGLTEKDFLKERKRFFKKKSIKETYYSLLINISEKHKDFSVRHMAHIQLALDRCKEGKEFQNHLKEAAKNDLLRLKSMGVRRVQISTAGEGNACPQCQEQANKILDIDEALKSMPVPCEYCSNSDICEGFCRCCYIAVPK